MDDQHLRTAGDPAIDGGLVSIHCEGQSRDLVHAFDLEAVLPVILDGVDVQVFIQIGNQYIALHNLTSTRG